MNIKSVLGMRNILLLIIVALFSSCNNTPKDGVVTVEIKDVLQVKNYTYLYVKGKGPSYWMATSSMSVSQGDSFTYKGGLKMKDFYSAELDRTFEEILFLDNVNPSQAATQQELEEVSPGSMLPIEKSDVQVEVGKGSLTVADLYSNYKEYNGKSVRVTGEVTKFNPEIMGRNWVHIQDGTEFEGKFDLTATSADAFTVGSKVTIEGILAINQDFGFGYKYEILLENAHQSE